MIQNYIERARLSQELRDMGVEIDLGDHRPIEEIAQAFGIVSTATEVVQVVDGEVEVL